MKAQRIEITLHGSNGSRITEVSAKGFTTRHVATPREAVPSIFSPVDTPAITPAVIEPTTPVETPIGDRMTALISHLDSITSENPSETEPEATPESDSELSEGQQLIVKALRKTRSYTLESIANRTGLNALYIMLECRNLAKLGIVEIESTVTCRRYRLAVS